MNKINAENKAKNLLLAMGIVAFMAQVDSRLAAGERMIGVTHIIDVSDVNAGGEQSSSASNNMLSSISIDDSNTQDSASFRLSPGFINLIGGLKASALFGGRGISTTEINWEWSDDSTFEIGYRVLDSGNSNISGNLASGTTFFYQQGIASGPNTPVTVSIESFDHLTTVRSAPVTRYTLANPLAQTPEISITSTTIAATWDDNLNPNTITSYRVEVAENETFAFGASSSVPVIKTQRAMRGVVGGLTPNTSYYLRVVPVNNDGTLSAPSVIVATVTPASIPVLDRMVVSANGLTVHYISSNPASTVFTLEISLDANFNSIEASSVTVVSPAIFEGLVSNTAYFMRAKATNRKNHDTSHVSFGNALTLAPALSVQSFQVFSTSITVSLNGNGSSLGTRVRISTGAFDVSNTVSGVLAASSPQAELTLNGLVQNAVHSVYARAINNNDIPGPVATVTASTATLAQMPILAQASNIQADAITLSWNANGNSTSTVYLTHVSTWPNFTNSYSSTTLDTFFTTRTWTSNSSYFFQVAAINKTGSRTAFTPIIEAVTLVLPVTQVTVDSDDVYISSMDVSWVIPAGNLPGTQYLVEISLDNFSTIQISALTAINSARMTPLRPSTNYSLRVVSVGHRGIRSAPSQNMNFMTGNVPPLNFAASSTTLIVSWNDHVAPTGSEYQIEFATVQAGGLSAVTRTPLSANTSWWMIGGLAVNTSFHFQVSWVEQGTGIVSPMVEGGTRTFAAVPDAPQMPGAGFDVATLILEPGSNPTADPDNTRFAVLVQVLGTLNSPHHDKYVRAHGDMDNPSDSPVWQTLSEWNGVDGLEITHLNGSALYHFHVKAMNGNGVITSTSVPAELFTAPRAPRAVWLARRPENSWINVMVTSFTAFDSAHYHYTFNTDPNSPIPTSANAGFETGQPVTVTATDEGPWFLHVMGDNFRVPLANGLHIPLGTDKIQINVDVTEPQITGVQARFSPTDNNAIADNTPTPHAEPYFTWTAPDNSAESRLTGRISSVTAYAVSFSTGNDPGEAGLGREIYVRTNSIHFKIAQRRDRSSDTYYFRVRALDMAGNWGPSSEVFRYRVVEDDIRPTATLNNITPRQGPDGRFLAAGRNLSLRVQFDKIMNSATVTSTEAVIIRALRDNLATRRSAEISYTSSYNETSRILTITPNSALSAGWLYEVVITTAVTDLGSNMLYRQIRTLFETKMDRNVRNRFVGDDGLTIADIPAGAFEEDASVSIGLLGGGTTQISVNGALGAFWHAPMMASAHSINVANQKMIALMGPFAQPVTIREFNAIKEDGTTIKTNFNAAVSITIPYLDVNNDGYVDGTNPRVRVKNLKVFVLDETRNVWHKLPGSEVDDQSNASLSNTVHFSVYAVFGVPDFDVSNSYAYPVPFKPAEGHNKITFANLPTQGKIRIYTVAGELARDILFTDPTDGKVEWDVANSASEQMGSDVYLYIIESGSNKKTGKIMVIR
ncbi:MAG: hypothetical protein A2901_02650 [Elusimicrobia bacterium RIFCSPLOWO2_01_FULL_54_10]|nr:MAG: hypothetical protein A2901_02650 [Elusimicrobia bacterium RIFCSPLOWO2_01_FULL_54_10]